MSARSRVRVGVVGLGLAVGGCAIGVGSTEGLLTQAGFRKVPADTPKRAEHLQTMRPHRLIRRTSDGKAYYVYGDPDYCKCLFVGSESAYATYRTLVRQQEEAIALQEERSEEVEGVK
jgi:hypothetical protein